MAYWWLIIPGVVLLVALLAVVAFIFWLERAGRWRQEQLRQRGVTVEATVEGVTLDDGRWAVGYRFYDSTGQDQVGMDYLDANRHEQPAEGAKVRVVYLPDRPWVSGLAALWLGSRAPVR